MKDLIKARVSLLGCLLLLSAACGGLISTRGGAPTSPLIGGRDARGELTKAMTVMLAAKSYRSRTVSSSSSGTTGTNTIEFVAPNRFHITRQTNLPGHAPSTQETIVIGSDTWMKLGNGGWQKFPMNLGELIAQFRDPKVVDEIAKAADVKFVGSEDLDGSPMKVYQYTLGDADGKGFKSTVKAWIAVTDNLPHKTDGETQMDVLGKPTTTKTTVSYYDYGADIKIEPPI